jgi:hypothetical protein
MTNLQDFFWPAMEKPQLSFSYIKEQANVWAVCMVHNQLHRIHPRHVSQACDRPDQNRRSSLLVQVIYNYIIYETYLLKVCLPLLQFVGDCITNGVCKILGFCNAIEFMRLKGHCFVFCLKLCETPFTICFLTWRIGEWKCQTINLYGLKKEIN